MNERIKELMVQVCKEQGLPFTVEHNRAYMLDNFSEKFAELIVRECAHVAVFKDSGTVATAAVAGHMAAGRSIAAKLIKEHFGLDGMSTEDKKTLIKELLGVKND